MKVTDVATFVVANPPPDFGGPHWITAIKFDPVGPYSAFDPRQLSLEALDHTERSVGSIRDAAGSMVGADVPFVSGRADRALRPAPPHRLFAGPPAPARALA